MGFYQAITQLLSPATPDELLRFFTVVSALAASVAALATVRYTYLTRKLYLSQIEPKVIVYAAQDMHRRSIIVLIIENIGKDTAYELKFRHSRPIPARAFGTSTPHATQEGFIDDGPLIEGIPALEPGGKRVITWGQYAGLLHALNDEPIKIDFTYNSPTRGISGNAVLDVASLSGIDASDTPLQVIATKLDVIGNKLGQVCAVLTQDIQNRQSKRNNK